MHFFKKFLSLFSLITLGILAVLHPTITHADPDTTPPSFVSAYITGDHSVTITYSETLWWNFSDAYANFTGDFAGKNIIAQSENSSSNHIVLIFDGPVFESNFSGTLDILAGEVQDFSGNAFGGLSGVLITRQPQATQVIWNDVDASRDFSGTDTLTVQFSTVMNESSITTENIDSRLGLSAGTFGTSAAGLSLSWDLMGDPSFSTLTITLGSDTTIVHGATINPSSSVTNSSGAPDATPSNLILSTDYYFAEFWNLPAESDESPAFPTGEPDYQSNSEEINFMWSEESPNPAINTDDFAARFTRTTTLTNNHYTFSFSELDDGVKLYIDDELIFSSWVDQGSASYNVEARITPGEHTIVLEYYENGGGAGIIFSMSGDTLADTVYVDSTYASELANDGHTWGYDAFSNIFSAISATAGNGTVHIGDAEWATSDSINLTFPITIDGEGAGITRIKNVSCTTVFNIQSSNVTIQDLTAGSYDGFGSDLCTSSDVIYAVGTSTTPISSISLSHVDLHGGDGGVYFGEYISDATVTGSTVSEAYTGIYLASSTDVTISGSTLENNTAEAIFFTLGSCEECSLMPPSMITIDDNLIQGNLGAGITLETGDTITISSNTISDNGWDWWDISGGIVVRGEWGETRSLTISGNTLSQNSAHGIYIHQPTDLEADAPTLSDNIIVRTGMNDADETYPATAGVTILASSVTCEGNSIGENSGSGIVLGSIDVYPENVTISTNILGSFTLPDTTSYGGNTANGLTVVHFAGTANSIHQNIIRDNALLAAENSNGSEIDLTLNYWGHFTGPFHSSEHMTGRGDTIGNDILFTPYNEGPETLTLNDPLVSFFSAPEDASEITDATLGVVLETSASRDQHAAFVSRNDDLLAFWRFENMGPNEGSLSIPMNVGGADPYLYQGHYGSSAKFDGVSALFANESILSSRPEFTLAGWVYIDEDVLSGQRRGFFGENNAFEVGFDTDHLTIYTDLVGNVSWEVTPENFPVRTWHHIAAVFEPSGTNPLTLYVDGVAVAEGGSSGPYVTEGFYESPLALGGASLTLPVGTMRLLEDLMMYFSSIEHCKATKSSPLWTQEKIPTRILPTHLMTVSTLFKVSLLMAVATWNQPRRGHSLQHTPLLYTASTLTMTTRPKEKMMVMFGEKQHSRILIAR